MTNKVKTLTAKFSRFFWESLFITLLSIIILFVAIELDFFERLHEFSRDHEDWEVDEIFSLIIISSIALIFILYRNAKHLKVENTLRINAEEKIKKMAFYDGLTQLPNRELLILRLKDEVEQARKKKQI